MLYMRIPRNKFWGWVVISMAVGLGIGLAIMFVRTSSLASQIKVLQNRVDSASAAATETADSVDASVTALTERNVQLTADLAAAKAQIKTLKKTPTTSSTSGSTAAIAVSSRTVSPSTVKAAGTITLTAAVTGHPDSVTMRVYTTTKSFDKTYSLRRVSTSGNSETWRLVTKAGSSEGTYHYYATAIKGSTRKTMPGAAPKSFTVS